ncbi:MAG: WD40 repeat domain-containing protein [Deltaproteobacteria bacterium]|nr:WD40 repeat domain-containing protein [Deltaproteobacteria bacterium]
MARRARGRRGGRRPGGPVAALAWLGSAADGAARLASGGADRTVRLYRVGAEGVADAVVIHAWDGPLRGLAVSPDGRFFATVADEPWAQLWPSELPTGVAARAAVEAMLAREAVTLP